MRDGKRLVTDGPFAETREQLGGYYLIDAKDLDEAIGIAATDSGRALGNGRNPAGGGDCGSADSLSSPGRSISRPLVRLSMQGGLTIQTVHTPRQTTGEVKCDS